MKPDEVAVELQRQFGETIRDVLRFRGEVTAVVERESIVTVCTFLRDELTFTYLSDISCVDWLDRSPRFDVVYQLTSFEHWIRFRLKVLTGADERVPTVIPIWGAANWAEREVWDMFGVEFEGHPDMRRLLLPEGWIGFPLRKDFPQTQIALPRPRADKIVD
ncbi:MAG: NADH-quinone oxidoreductase subunit C [Chloroflexota bacterium]